MSKFYCKAFTNTVLALSLFLLIFSINPKNAFAGDFVHGHSGGCYSTTTARCDNHHIRTSHGTNYYHCQRCLIHQTFNETVYWDVCDNGLVPDSDCGYVQTCSVCGYVRCNDNPSPGSHNYTTTYVACGYGAGEKLASVSLSPSTTSWTNGAVTLSADVSVANSRFSLSGSPFDFGGGYSGSSSMEATDNGSYSVTVKAADGTTASASYTVSNIDKTSPSLSLSKSTEAWTEEGLTISASGSDGESGVAGYSFDGSNFGGETSMKVTKNGTYSVSVKDNAGNVTTESITISNIGRDPEVVRAEKEAAEKAAAEKAAAEKAAAEKAAAEKAAAEKAAAEKAAAEKAAAEKAAAEKAAAEKAAAEKAAADKAAGDKTTNKTGTSTGTGASTVAGTNQGDKTTNKTGSTLAGLLGIGSKKDKVTEGSLGEKSDSSKNAASDKNGAIDVSGNVLTVNGGSAGGINGLVSVNNGKTPSNLMGGSDKNGSELYDNTADGDASDGQVMAGEELAISKLEGKRGFAALSREERAMWYVRVGSVLLLIGLGWFSTFSYVYMIEKGKIKPVSIINVKKENNRLILEISEKKLSKHGRYMIYYSPWLRLTKKDKPVYIMLKERENVLNTDNGMSFAY